MKRKQENPLAAPKRRGQFASICLRYKKNKMAMFGLVVFLIVVFFAVFADGFANYETDAIKQNVVERLQAPGGEHLFGTDAYGRDLFARIIFGARLSLMISLSTVTLSLVVGCLLGAVCAYYGGWLDSIVMRLVDVFLAVPMTLMAVTVVAALGTSIPNLILALTISMIPPFVRIVRSAVLQVKGSDYIEAAFAYGSKDLRIIFSHVLPNAIGPIIVQATLNLASVLLSVAALGFIGLGVPSPQPEWGTMLAESKSQMRYYPYLVMIPGIAIAVTVLAINLIGDGLRDALDPRLKN
ncbi:MULTISPECIES: ABC transporter permease [Anaerotruncus]|uniref:ABC transporter permease n=2 Tax=Oscillospiraceae TaxID=216572 RepID=UPI000836B87E|nr:MULTISPECIES: ABC transporter permease [Anaerotruncus]RGX56939.1 ABC transporter permease [Anaerotruncus sp. AF02-27]